jgi:hypothetical protein
MRDIPKIALQRLRKQSEVDAHPDANLLAAFTERGLAEAERENVMEHLALCGDCRDVLALAWPAEEEIGASVRVVAVRRNWFSWPVLRWGVVALGLAAFAFVGVMQYERRQGSEAALSVQVASNQPAAGAAQSILPAASAVLTAVPETKRQTADATEKKLLGSHAAAGASLKASPPVVASAPSTVAVDTSQPVESAQNQAADQLVLSRKEQRGSVTGADVVKAKNPAPPETSVSALAAPNVPLQTEPGLMARALPRWAISSSGGLQRSFDAGRSWEDVKVEETAVAGLQPKNQAGSGAQSKNKITAQTSPIMFRAVAAIGPEVWAGGSSAMLYHSADSGTRWTRVFPSMGDAVLRGDITAIGFPDALHGAITTSTGEVWTTADNGQSWARRQ